MVAAGLITFACALLIVHATNPDFNDGFLEGSCGTYFSVGYLVVDALVCMAIGAALTSWEWPGWRWVAGALILFMLAYAICCVVALVLGELYHDRRRFYFNFYRQGYKFIPAGLAIFAVGATLAWVARRNKLACFWFLLGLLFYLVALDDLLQFHEGYGKNFGQKILKLPKTHPLTVRINDIWVLCYGLLAMALFWANRHSLARLPWTLWTLGVAFLAFGFTTFADFLHLERYIEESVKVFAGSMILTALLTAWLELSRNAKSAEA